MQHREQFMAFLADPDDPTFTDWIWSHSPLERVDILTEFKEFGRELNAQDGDESIAELIREMEAHLDTYQDAYLEQKLAELNRDIAKDVADEAIARYVENREAMKAYLREGILLNAPNAGEMREVVLKMIDLEQVSGLYRPEEWAWFEGK